MGIMKPFMGCIRPLKREQGFIIMSSRHSHVLISSDNKVADAIHARSMVVDACAMLCRSDIVIPSVYHGLDLYMASVAEVFRHIIPLPH